MKCSVRFIAFVFFMGYNVKKRQSYFLFRFFLYNFAVTLVIVTTNYSIMIHTRKTFLLAVLSLFFFALTASAQRRGAMRATDPEFFRTDDAKRIGDQILAYQRVTGGWPKNIDMARRMTDQELAQVLADKQRTDDSTIDNDATTIQMVYLARLYQATKDKRYGEAFRKAVEYLLSGQYDNGGWPQFWPDMHGYQIHITYNDNAIVNTLNLLRDIASQKHPYEGNITDKKLRERMTTAFDKGVECILKTQIMVDGVPTVWCQQHYRDTYLPAPARAFELPSYCTSETGGIVRLLMSLPNPDERVKKAVNGAMRWIDDHKLTGYKLERKGTSYANRDTRLVPITDPAERAAATPLWARFYDLKYAEPYVCDRDGIMRRHLHEIGRERRNGYGWYNSGLAGLYPVYEEWAKKYGVQPEAIDVHGKGGNETGRIEWFRKPVVDRSQFDVIVRPGESIQAAVDAAPADTSKLHKVLILKGMYHEKVIIDRPNVVLVGENRDSTIIQIADASARPFMSEYKGKPVHMGVIVLTERANDCVISGLTVYNNYGTTIENTTTHQMAVFGRATRTIIINSNIWADGNDALALWAEGGNGMYYHADLFLRCPGVDFLCPRGWCYVTRSRFYGDGRAMIWHDGRGDKTKRLVITCSDFDAASPTILGRYHHDSKFFIVNCHMSENVLNRNIQYAYSDKVLDPCPWGERIYYFGCHREGGHGTWLDDNMLTSEEHAYYHTCTARWTFNNQWDPEQRIRDLWDILAY